MKPAPSVCQSQNISKTALTIFLIFCMVLDIDKVRKVMEPDYPKKIGSSTKYENVVKITVFDFFSKTALTILTKLAQKVELINSEQFRKLHVQKNCSRDIHPQSSDFGQKWQKWCPKIELYLSRTVNATENLFDIRNLR